MRKKNKSLIWLTGWETYRWGGSYAPVKELIYQLVVSEVTEHGVSGLLTSLRSWEKDVISRPDYHHLIMCRLENF